ncbi:MAG: hypothetical protein CVU20_10940 [Betaproteobacteria bacterium HGW-Betaproteobacteria-14]|jgi:hypothetical protein|nr:MAG: hypothetical protein CVU20_10940 [Betaproteobacteria bacterium HGW-Betaproteobacteria-14]
MIIYTEMDTGKKVVELREEYGEEVLLSNWLPQPEVGVALQEAVSHRDFLRSPVRHDSQAADRDAEAFLRAVYLCQE